MLDRAYSLLEIKSIDEDARIIEGVASTPVTDRMGDIVEPMGASFKLPLPMMWMHGKDPFVGQTPVGNVVAARPSADGIPVRIQMERTDEPGRLKDILDFAWQTVKKRLVRGLSIGFRPIGDPEPIKGTFGLRFQKWEWLELSGVAIAANQDASISLIKSLTSSDASHAPGTTGTQTVKTVRKTPMKTIAEQIASFEATRQAKSAEMAALMAGSGEKGETLDAEQGEKYDAVKAEIKEIDKHLERLKDMEEINKFTARPVNGNTTSEATESRTGRPVAVTVKDNLPPGIGFTRIAIAKTIARIDGTTAAEYAAQRWPDDARVKAYFQKAAVPAGTTQYALWAGNLVDTTNLASEFVEFLRPQTLVGRLPLRRVPFNIRFTSQTTGAVANWVGEGKGKPVTSFQTGANTLLYTKIAAIAVITQELARFSAPSAETLVRDELARAVTERLDIDFIDPAQAAVANVNPASITNGLTALTSAGTSADNIRTDIQNLLEQFILNNMNAGNVVLIMPNTLALAASVLVNSLGQPEFPGLTMNGGTIAGVPVFTTQYAANQSGGGNLVIALDPSAILLADDGGVDVSASMEASVEMSDAPTQSAGSGGTAPVASTLVSLWQTNSIGIKAERFVNWTKARSTAVVYMDDVNWGSIGSPS